MEYFYRGGPPNLEFYRIFARQSDNSFRILMQELLFGYVASFEQDGGRRIYYEVRTVSKPKVHSLWVDIISAGLET